PGACGPGFMAFLADHVAAWSAVRDGEGDAAALITRAESHRDSAPYGRLYALWRERLRKAEPVAS
ncbi:hypothetical protein WDZ92_38220, partial [Nostoc sp. NIES-2111]